MEDEKISVIVPVYNVEPYLERCVDSILRQTYTNLECILVDDGSPDRCPQICDDYAAKDSRVRVIHKPNGGLSSARNAGLDTAQGEYIAFVDSDDYIDPRMLELLFEALKNADADLAMCDIECVYENAEEYVEHNSPVKNEILSLKEAAEKLFIVQAWYYVVACNKLYKRKVWREIRFPVGEIHEDERIVHKIFLECETIVTIDKKLYFYYQRAGSIMHRGKDEKNLVIFSIWTDRFLISEPFLDEAILVPALRTYCWDFMHEYFEVWKKNPHSAYFPPTKKALMKVMPLLVRYKVCSYREIISQLIFLCSDRTYYRLFMHGK